MKRALIVGLGPTELAIGTALGAKGEIVGPRAALRAVDPRQHSIAICSASLRRPSLVVRLAEKVPTLFLSTADVFSGPGPHKEWDRPAPLTHALGMVAAAEDAVLLRGGCVVRVGTVLDAALLRALLLGRQCRIPNFRLSLSYPPFVARDVVHILSNWVNYIARVTHSVCWPGLSMPELHDTANKIYGHGCLASIEPITRSERDLGRPIDSRLSNTFLPASRHVIDALVSSRDKNM